LLFRHGDFRAAAERYQELLTAARRYGSVPGQAEALTQLATILQLLGQFTSARQTLTLAQELVVRLGQSHRLHFAAMVGNETTLGYYTRADWPALAESNQRYLAGPEALRSPLGLMAAACAALAYTKAASTERAMRILGELARVVDHLEPHAYMQNHVVCIAGVAIWELEAKGLGPLFRRLATQLVHARLAPGIFAHELTAARMAALAGDWPEAEAWFARARLVEDACGQRPGRAFVDLDEAYVILHRTPADHRRAQTLLRASADQFRTLGMESWLERAEELATSPTSPPVEHPHGLTGREIEVLQLVASGYTSKEVAARLVVSVATVQRHIANLYAKINARGRADATAYASRHGMLPQ
jgi:ATP/maltotriose-dependent transcriptional regulator MalT